MTNLSEDQYDRIAAHGKPTVTLDPRTWFRWGAILRSFRRKRPAAPMPGVTPPAPVALPEPTPPMQRVTVPQAPIALTTEQRILAEAVAVVARCWPDAPAHAGNEPTLLLCARGLPMPFAPYCPDGEWRKGSRERIASEWQVCQMRNERALTDALARGQTVYMDIVMRVPDVSEWRKLATNITVLHAYARRFLC